MPRTTPDKVRRILDTDLDNPHIEAYIEGANQLVTAILEGKNLTDELMENIERWLTAHMIASTRDREAIMQKAGPAEQRFSDIFEKRLDSTSYGQMAIALDPTGGLFDLSVQRRPIRIHAIRS